MSDVSSTPGRGCHILPFQSANSLSLSIYIYIYICIFIYTCLSLFLYMYIYIYIYICVYIDACIVLFFCETDDSPRSPQEQPKAAPNLFQGGCRIWHVGLDISKVQKGTGSVRFVSVPDFSTIHRFGSVRFGQIFFPVRRGSDCVFRTRRGSVRFGSVRLRVRNQSVLELSGSVRFGSARFGSAPIPAVETPGVASVRQTT